MTKEGDCAWCGAGKYQTGVGLVAEANCTWCVAGKYQSGSGRETKMIRIDRKNASERGDRMKESK